MFGGWVVFKERCARFSALFLKITSFTVNTLPYLLLPQLILRDNLVILNALPYVLFYTFRRTTLFLFRGYHPRAERLAAWGLAAATVGCLLGLFGQFNPLFWDIAGVGIGVAAALLPPAVRAFNRRTTTPPLPKIKFAAIYQFGALLLLLGFIELNGTKGIGWSFMAMLLYLGLGWLGWWASPLRQPLPPMVWRNIKLLSLNIILTSAIFLSLVNLRLARNEGVVAGLLKGLLVLAIVFPIVLLLFSKRLLHGNAAITWTVRAHGFLRGICIDFVAVYGTIYVFVILGSQFYVWVILMYVVAMAIGTPVVKWLHSHFPKISANNFVLLLLALGLLLTFIKPLFLLGILNVRIAVSQLNKETLGELAAESPLTTDEQVLIVPRLMSLGGLSFQTCLWITMLTVARLRQISLSGLLNSYAHKTVSTSFTGLISTTHWVMVLVVLLAAFVVFLIDRRSSTVRGESD